MKGGGEPAAFNLPPTSGRLLAMWLRCIWLSRICSTPEITCGRELARDLARSGSRFCLWCLGLSGIWLTPEVSPAASYLKRHQVTKCPALGLALTSSGFPHSGAAPWARVERTPLSRRSLGILPVDPLRGACVRPAPKSRLAVSVRPRLKIKSNGNGNGNGNGE